MDRDAGEPAHKKTYADLPEQTLALESVSPQELGVA